MDPEEELSIIWPDIDVPEHDDFYTPHRGYLELNDLLDAKIRLLEQEIEQLESARDCAASADLDSHAGSCALAETDGDPEMAQVLIIEHLDASPQRALDCVNRGYKDAGLDGSDFVSRLFGEDIDGTRWASLRQCLSWISDESTPSHGQMPLDDFYLSSQETWDRLEAWDFLADETTAFQSAVMLSGAWRDPIDYVARLPINPPYDADEDDLRTGRFLGAAYGFLCLREQGVVTDDVAPVVTGLEPGLDSMLLPWLLPASSNDNGDAIALLCVTLAAEGLAGAPLEESPFILDAPPDWVEEIRNTAASVSHVLTRSIPAVVQFSHKDVQIVLVDSGDTVIAWVGNKKNGVITSFDKENFAVSAMPSPASAFASGCAISLYVDLAFRPRTRAVIERKISHAGRSRRPTFGPTPEFSRQLRQVRGGTHAPPKAHYVAPHIRHLYDRRPNRAHVAEAPPSLRVRMGPHDTWVTGHMRGRGNVDEMVDWLRGRSMLADMIGLL